jgi:hypothetical protein
VYSGLACVDEGVLLHVRLLVEALPTVLAGVGPDVGVDEQMRGQRGRALEAFPADLTVEAPLLWGSQGALVDTSIR